MPIGLLSKEHSCAHGAEQLRDLPPPAQAQSWSNQLAAANLGISRLEAELGQRPELRQHQASRAAAAGASRRGEWPC